MLPREIFQVLRAIEFDNQLVREANEVHHITTQRCLASKLDPKLPGPQEMPKSILRLGRFIAKASRKITLLLIAIHALIQPPPQPSV